ncbi:MAG: hypothetical protein M1814_003465 [Vezdaea aestivalis]|nr:MAG: hypothetical protein M1814_003465 [Vezdaea aestivalis]
MFQGQRLAPYICLLLGSVIILTSTATLLESREEVPWFPDAQVRCIGRVPLHWAGLVRQGLVDLPPLLQLQVNHTNSRQLCAQETYGGDQTWNAGFRCALGNPGVLGSSISDDIFLVVREDRAKSKLISPIRPYPPGIDDVYEFCRLRCRCFNAGAEVSPTERPAQVVLDAERVPAAPYDLNPERGSKIDIINDDVLVWSRELTQHYIDPKPSSSSSSAPICDGPLPPWQLPAPFAGLWRVPTAMEVWMYWERDGDAQRLCAAQWYEPLDSRERGSSLGNAGAVCRLLSPQGSGDKVEELVMEEYLAHPALTRHNEVSPSLGLAVELWCRRACYCRSEFPTGRPFGRVPSSVQVPGMGTRGEKGRAEFRDEGVIGLQIPMESGRTVSFSFRGPKTEASSCQSADKQTCEAPALADVLRKPQRQTTMKISTGFIGGKGSCSGLCTEQKDCAGDCLCAVKSNNLGQSQAGSQPWRSFGRALCTAATQVIGTKRGHKFGGRDIGSSDEWDCVCNSTFVGPTCCRSLSGS